jgi:hypothetical protein
MAERIVADMPEDSVYYVHRNSLYVDDSGGLWLNCDYTYEENVETGHFPVLRDGSTILMELHAKPNRFRGMDVLDKRSDRFRVKWVEGLLEEDA